MLHPRRGIDPGQPATSHALGDVRAAELADAARVLGLRGHELLAYPDGRLAEIPVADLAATSSPPRGASAATCWWSSTTAG